MNEKYIIAVAAFLSFPASAMAYDMERATANLSGELSQCAGFMMIVSQVTKERDPETAEAYAGHAFTMHQMATELSNERVATARTQLAIKEMSKDLDEDAGNISILLNEHLELCQEMSNDIGPRLQYWLDQKD